MDKWGREGREERSERVWQANIRVSFYGRKMRTVHFSVVIKIVTRL